MKTFPHVITKIVTLLACWPGCFATTLSAQQQQPSQQNFQSRLSLMKDSEFKQWFEGTEWELEAGGKKQSYWFISPTAFIWTGETGSGNFSAYGYKLRDSAKGQVEWFKKPFSKRDPQSMRVGEYLDTATFVFKEGEVQGKLINRKSHAKPNAMTTAQFGDWLQGKRLRCDGHSVSMEENGWLVSKWKGWRKSVRSQPTHLAPGLLQVSTDKAGWNQRVFLFSPDLQSYTMYTSDKSLTGKISNALPKEKGTITSKGGTISIKDAPEVKLRATHAFTYGLMVKDLGGSRYAGLTSKLAVSALKLETMAAATLAFNQGVGEDMESALREVARFHALRHGGWPRGFRIELAYADKYSAKDGPSAAVASALVLESLISGVTLGNDFAVTGDLNADGTIQPVGGVTAKLRAASKSGMKLVAIPEENRSSAVDLALLEGASPFLGTQIFSVATFDDALKLAAYDKDPALQSALSDFEILSTELRNKPDALKSSGTLQSLTHICNIAPNHVGARMLLTLAQGKMPARLSAGGSMDAIDQAVADILEATRSDLSASGKLDAGKVGTARTRLQRLRTLVDSRFHAYVDAWMNWAALADQIISRRSALPQVVSQFKQAALKITAERELLNSDVELHEELMQ